MDIFKKKTIYNDLEESTPAQEKPKQNGFRDSIRIDRFKKEARWFKLKEELMQHKIKEEDISKEDLDGVTKLLRDEIKDNKARIKYLENQIAKQKKNN